MPKRLVVLAVATLALILAGELPANAGSLIYTPITFDYNSYNYGRDINYPTGNPVVLGGVPFNIPGSPNYNTWDSNFGSGSHSLTIPVNVANVQEVDTLINTSWGQGGAQYTSLTFNWSGGLSPDVIYLTDGVDIRDWWNGAFTNTISPPTVQVYSGTGTPDPHYPTRVDKQLFTFTDPQYAGKTLDSVVITNWGGTDLSRAFLYGLTVGAPQTTVPEPSMLIILGLGFAGVGAAFKRLRQR